MAQAPYSKSSSETLRKVSEDPVLRREASLIEWDISSSFDDSYKPRKVSLDEKIAWIRQTLKILTENL